MAEVLISSMWHEQRPYLEWRFSQVKVSWATELEETIKDRGFNLFVDEKHKDVAAQICFDADMWLGRKRYNKE